MAGGIERGDIRLCRLAAPDKQRPVVVLTRSSAIGYLAAVTVAPVTSAIRGSEAEVLLTVEDGMKADCVINLHNVVTVRKSALGRKVARVGERKMGRVCSALEFALGCEAPPEAE